MGDNCGGWELTKENIQPLSSGRRMAYLDESLPVLTAGDLTDQQQYETHHLEEVGKLVDIARKRLGDDPLQLWLNVLKYIEQHFPTMSQAVKSKHEMLLQEAVRQFFEDGRYQNDQRYVEVIIRSIDSIPQKLHISALQNILEGGIGKTVSDIYVRLAELYVSLGDTKRAHEIIQDGFKNNALPQNLLQEMKTHIEDAWAESFKKQLEEGVDEKEGLRNSERQFASSVPVVGENNEAISIRRNLQPAAPTSSTWKGAGGNQQKKRGAGLKLFGEEDEQNSHPSQKNDSSASAPSVSGKVKVLETAYGKNSDRENRLEAARWNTESSHLNNPVIPAPPEGFEIYEETSSVQSTSSASKVAQPDKRVLKEIRVEEDPGIKHLSSVSNPNRVQCPGFGSVAVQEEPITRPPKMGLKPFFEDIKYKSIPDGVSRIAWKEDKWWDDWERRQKKKLAEQSEVAQLKKKVEELSELSQSGEKFAEQLKLVEIKLAQKDDRIRSLEKENEDLINQLTHNSTENNVQVSKWDRERRCLAEKIQELQNFLKEVDQKLERSEKERDVLAKEKLMREGELLKLRQLNELKMNESINDSSEYEGIVIERNSMAQLDRKPIVIDVRSRNTENYSLSSSEQGTSEVCRFNLAEATCEANSFMPKLGDESLLESGDDVGKNVGLSSQRKALVDRPLEDDMMNDTPATAPPMDFEEPAPLLGFRQNFLTNPKKNRFAIFESFSQSKNASMQSTSKGVSTSKAIQPKDQENMVPSTSRFATVSESRAVAFPSDENLPPPALPSSLNQDFATAGDIQSQKPFEIFQDSLVTNEENVPTSIPQFLRPEHPSQKKSTFSIPTNDNLCDRGRPSSSSGCSDVSQRLNLLSSRSRHFMQADDDEEEEVIVRRHQQTGVDLNISNLTTALMLGPKPLTNSTPERERTMNRDFRGLSLNPGQGDVEVQSRAANAYFPPETEEMVGSDMQGTPSSLISRYNSVLNDNAMNLSTIQETSREFRSRSTTGSSSGSGVTTMSSTRFGATATGTTPYFGSMHRSSSIPRSASRISHQSNSTNNNGYYSDTNAK